MKTRFDAFWMSGPWRRIGKESARTRFLASVKTEQDWTDIQAARDAYNGYCYQNRKWYSPQMGSVWFGTRKGWRDWIPDEERVEALADDPQQLDVDLEAEALYRQFQFEHEKHPELQIPSLDQIKQRLAVMKGEGLFVVKRQRRRR